MGTLRTAWTIFKLKVVTALLRPLLQAHIRELEKEQKKTELQRIKRFEAVLRQEKENHEDEL